MQATTKQIKSKYRITTPKGTKAKKTTKDGSQVKKGVLNRGVRESE